MGTLLAILAFVAALLGGTKGSNTTGRTGLPRIEHQVRCWRCGHLIPAGALTCPRMGCATTQY